MARRATRESGAAAAASLAKALRAAAIAEGRRAEDVVVLDLRGQTLVTDYFVIATGMSRVQIRAIIDAIADGLADVRPRGVREGDEAAGWVLLDYGDIVVHVFAPEARAFYRLERLWADAPAVTR
ncbi:MAG: ribosome silencing factor [Armatimonadota bacterium]|nr:ribosome silencing factor [Armatimonadota bacterium]